MAWLLCAPVLLADTQNGDISNWAGVFATIASSGFAGVVAWYLLTKALPKMAEKQDLALREQQGTFQAAMAAQQILFAAEMKEQRDKADKADATRRSEDELRRAESKAGLQAVLEHCEREAKQRAELYKVELSLMQKQLEYMSEQVDNVLGLLGQPASRRKRPRAGGQGDQLGYTKPEEHS